ncbi:hypothetical protein HANVADRAFT_52563 [Hanseniaspora valbyensis NRRL Y-1626]|uniref:Protein ZIP4 homolog n=1 Tax=Hanseniaspora valbyensis NRRL Y-1626 TaxID=766949 RepID=A0A1B7TEB6_9ASCO|nr:hypothetical protein HANVADRAFT_52563 [Hanseniaspora valbyensis NRRL Y-1626]
MADISSSCKSTITEFVEACNDINDKFQKNETNDSKILSSLTNKINLLIPVTEKFERSIKTIPTLIVLDDSLLLSLENSCSNLYNTLILESKNKSILETPNYLFFFLNVKYFVVLLFFIFHILSKECNTNYGKNCFKFFVSLIKFCLDLYLQVNIIDKSLNSLINKIIRKSEKYSDQLVHFSEGGMLTDFYLTNFQVYFHEKDLTNAALYESKIKNTDIKLNENQILEFCKTVYNCSLKIITESNNSLNTEYVVFLNKASQMIPLQSELSNNTSKSKFKNLKYSVLVLIADYYVRLLQFEDAEIVIEEIIQNYQIDLNLVILKIDMIKKKYSNTDPQLVIEYKEILKRFIMSIMSNNNISCLESMTTFFCDLAKYSPEEAFSCFEYVLTNQTSKIPLDIIEKLFNNRLFILTEFLNTSEEIKINQLKSSFDDLQRIIDQELSETSVNSIVTLVWNYAKKLKKKSLIKEALEWFHQLDNDIINNKISDETKNIIFRAMQQCELELGNFEKVYYIYEKKMIEEKEKNNNFKTQIILFKTKVKEADDIFERNEKELNILEKIANDCKDIILNLKQISKSYTQFYDFLYACFIDFKSNNPVLLYLLDFLFVENNCSEVKGNNENENLFEVNNSSSGLFSHLSFMRILRLAIQLHLTNLELLDKKIFIQEFPNIYLPKFEKLLEQGLNILMRFRQLKEMDINSSSTSSNQLITGSFTNTEINWFAAVAFNLENKCFQNDLYLNNMNMCKVAVEYINLIDKKSLNDLELKELKVREMRCICLDCFYKKDGNIFNLSEMNKLNASILKLIGESMGILSHLNDENQYTEIMDCVRELWLARFSLIDYEKKDQNLFNLFNNHNFINLLITDDELVTGCFCIAFNNYNDNKSNKISLKQFDFDKKKISLLINKTLPTLSIKESLIYNRKYVEWLFHQDPDEELSKLIRKILTKSSSLSDNEKEDPEIFSEFDWLSTHCWNVSIRCLIEEEEMQSNNNNTQLSKIWFDLAIDSSRYLNNGKKEKLESLRVEMSIR